MATPRQRRQRNPAVPTFHQTAIQDDSVQNLEPKSVVSASPPANPGLQPLSSSNMSNFLHRQPVWIILAVASGTCAAFNGVFAKLTTTHLTTSIASSISSSLLHLDPHNRTVDFLTRAFFFGMNLLFNLAMWALFTAALTRASSTTRVSIVNVSSNFMVTAVLGWMVFGEELKGLWWVGAAFLAVGNVVIGRREEGEGGEKGKKMAGDDGTSDEGADLLDGEYASEEEDAVELLDREENGEEAQRLRRGEEADDPV